jgi:hypothetical protein
MPTKTLKADAFIAYRFYADAVIAGRSFTADAWIMGDRWRHHRVRDHYGAESDLYVVLDSAIGPYDAGAPIHWVLEDMLARLSALENSERRRFTFVADAWLALSGTYGHGVVLADAAIKRTGMSGSFTANAYYRRGWASFTADAVISQVTSFTADAFLV